MKQRLLQIEIQESLKGMNKENVEYLSRLICNRCGYVEFYDETSVQNALALSGQKLLGIPVLVQLSEAEKNRLAMAAQRNA